MLTSTRIEATTIQIKVYDFFGCVLSCKYSCIKLIHSIDIVNPNTHNGWNSRRSTIVNKKNTRVIMTESTKNNSHNTTFRPRRHLIQWIKPLFKCRGSAMITHHTPTINTTNMRATTGITKALLSDTSSLHELPISGNPLIHAGTSHVS